MSKNSAHYNQNLQNASLKLPQAILSIDRTTHHAPRTTHHAPRTTHHAPRNYTRSCLNRVNYPIAYFFPLLGSVQEEFLPRSFTEFHGGLRCQYFLLRETPCPPWLILLLPPWLILLPPWLMLPIETSFITSNSKKCSIRNKQFLFLTMYCCILLFL